MIMQRIVFFAMFKPSCWVGLLAAVLSCTAVHGSSGVDILVFNPRFDQGINPNASGWQLFNGTAPNSDPSNYAEQIPHLPSRTMQLKSDGGNYIQQALVQDMQGNPVDASSFASWTVSFQHGYRRDAVTSGDHVIRVSLWNIDANVALASEDILIADPGGPGINVLTAAEVTLEYDNNDPALFGAGIALRVSSASPNLGGNAWQRTAVIDDVDVTANEEIRDPRLIAASSLQVSGSGAPVDFELVVGNGGFSQPLLISSATLAGPDAGVFSVTSFPGEIAPGGTGTIHLSLEPSGLVTSYFATLQLTSNDPRGVPHVVEISALIDDPDIAYNQWAASFGLDPNGDGARWADPDGDGLPNEEEFKLGSNPLDPSDPDGRAWLPRPEKAVVMMFSAHPDDEGIFFGGALPYYTQVRKVPVVLVSVTSGDYVLAPTVREQEMRNAAWVYGLRTHPIFPRFPDAPFSSLDQNFSSWGGGVGAAEGRLATAMEFAKWIRRYRPDVVLTHDFGGEYGHNNHKATAFATADAVLFAADPVIEIEGLAPWQVKKLYVNQYENNRIFHDHWEDVTIDTTGNGLADSTPRRVANLGLAEHKTQNGGNFRVSTVYATGENPGFSWDHLPSEHWGLYSSTVGPDTVEPDFVVMGEHYQGWARGDFLENITAFPDQDGDGLPDAWELHWFGGVTAANPQDKSGDSARTVMEAFVLGLNPLVADMTWQSAVEDGFAFQLPPATGPGYEGLQRRYDVLHSPDLDDWQVIATGVADGGVEVVSWPSGARGFARLRVLVE
jgi:LmbE family N-acetylglucosaminyl deacetylase